MSTPPRDVLSLPVASWVDGDLERFVSLGHDVCAHVLSRLRGQRPPPLEARLQDLMVSVVTSSWSDRLSEPLRGLPRSHVLAAALEPGLAPDHLVAFASDPAAADPPLRDALLDLDLPDAAVVALVRRVGSASPPSGLWALASPFADLRVRVLVRLVERYSAALGDLPGLLSLLRGADLSSAEGAALEDLLSLFTASLPDPRSSPRSFLIALLPLATRLAALPPARREVFDTLLEAALVPSPSALVPLLEAAQRV